MNITTKKTIEKCMYTSLIPEPPHLNKATFFVACVIEKGEGDVIFYSKDGKKSETIHVSENSCFIIPPFVATEHVNFDKSCFAQRNIHFDEATLKECCDLIDPSLFDLFLFNDFQQPFRLSSAAAVYLAECCSIVTGEDNKKFENIHRSMICTVLSSYLVSKMKNNTYPVWIRALTRNLKDINFLLLSIEDMVKTTHYSHGYVNREFKKYFGIPLKQYVLKKKLELASSMLVTSDLSMQEIVDKLFFSNISNFINLFKSQYSITPAKYRKENSSTISLDDYQDWGASVLTDDSNVIV